jgi:hypothetical protein
MFSIDIYSASAFYAVLPSVAEVLLAEGKAMGADQWIAIFPIDQSWGSREVHISVSIRELGQLAHKLVKKNDWPGSTGQYFWEGRQFLGRSWELLHQVMANGAIDCAGGSDLLRHVIGGGRQLVQEEGRHVAHLTSEEVRKVAHVIQSIDEQTFHAGFARAFSDHHGSPDAVGDCHYAWRRFREVRGCYQLAAEYGFALFLTACTKPMDVAKLEAWLRPDGCSDHGFLGPRENFQETMAADSRLLKQLGVCHEHVAGALEAAILRPIRCGSEPPYKLALVERTTAPIDIEAGGSGLGWQECPWGCDWREIDFIYALNPRYILQNVRTRERIAVPGLVVHMAREHHFFEGIGTFYRADPERLVRILELQPCGA